jgi:hypothetical protein
MVVCSENESTISLHTVYNHLTDELNMYCETSE